MHCQFALEGLEQVCRSTVSPWVLSSRGRQMPLNGMALAQGLKDVHALHRLIARLTASA